MTTTKTFNDDDIIQIGFRRYRFGSVAAYAARYNEDPEAAVARAIERGHETHWLNQEAAVITAEGRRPEPAKAELAFGDMVVFDGQEWIVRRAPNGNARLEEHAPTDPCENPDADGPDYGPDDIGLEPPTGDGRWV